MNEMKKGIDISYCQNHVNWDKLNVDFVIVRAGYGRYETQKDVMFESHYKNAKAKKIPVGAYWYSYAMTEKEARDEAKTCLKILKGKKFDYPIYYDVEENKQIALGKAKVSSIIKAFCSELEKAGYWTGFYTSAGAYNSVISGEVKKLYSCWIAHWDAPRPGISGDFDIWQYSVGHEDGISGDCDLDYCYVDFPKLIKAANKNGYKAEDKVSKKPSKKKKVTLKIDGKKYDGYLEEELVNG